MSPEIVPPYLRHSWPDAFDILVLLVYGGGFLLMVVLGYVFMVGDFRAYLRALKGTMIRVVHVFPTLPKWARYQTPFSLRALGLQMPCTPSEVKSAYHRLAEKHHPDRGGDPRQFQELRTHFERAMEYVTLMESERL